MNLAEFFGSDAVSLPRSGFQPGKHTFDSFLSQIFDDYLSCVKGLADPDFPAICTRVKSSGRDIKKLTQQIVAAVKQYLQGYPHLAYSEIERALKGSAFESLITTLSGFSARPPGTTFDNFLECTLHPPLYRLRSDRVAAATGALSRKDTFHVPFEKSALVRNQRYSIAGLPSLYLGSSIWISWEELGRPDLDSVFVSRFRIAEEVTVLDFQLPPHLAWQLYNYVLGVAKTDPPPAHTQDLVNRYNEAFIAACIVGWPLIAACSIRIDSRVGSFFPEYIIPQLLLQWVTKEKKVDGIRYFSTRASHADYYVNTNLVFPAREITPSGCCSYLRKKFHLIAPIPWELLQSLDLRHGFVAGPANSQALVKVADDLLVHYAATGFYAAESALAQLEDDPVAHRSGPVED